MVAFISSIHLGRVDNKAFPGFFSLLTVNGSHKNMSEVSQLNLSTFFYLIHQSSPAPQIKH